MRKARPCTYSKITEMARSSMPRAAAKLLLRRMTCW